MSKKTVQLRHPIGLNIMRPNQLLIINEEHNIPCPNCCYGIIKNWFGWSKICPICKGSNSIGTYIIKRIA